MVDHDARDKFQELASSSNASTGASSSNASTGASSPKDRVLRFRFKEQGFLRQRSGVGMSCTGMPLLEKPIHLLGGGPTAGRGLDRSLENIENNPKKGPKKAIKRKTSRFWRYFDDPLLWRPKLSSKCQQPPQGLTKAEGLQKSLARNALKRQKTFGVGKNHIIVPVELT